MQKFTYVQVKEVSGCYAFEENLVTLAENLEHIDPVKCFFVTGHLFTQEVAELPEIAEVIERTYAKKKYLVEVVMLIYEEGNINPHDELELDYVASNFTTLCNEDKVDVINVDYLTLDITEV